MNNQIITININTSEKYYEYAKIVAETIHEIYTDAPSLQELMDKFPSFKYKINVALLIHYG